MELVDDMLALKFAEYRKELGVAKICTHYMQYDWFRSPKTVRLDAKYGTQQMVYRDMGNDAVRDLANGINDLIHLTMKIQVWCRIIEGMEIQHMNEVLHEFVQGTATMALSSPYALKQRFYFATAHLSHQANVAILGENWVDNFETLPEDWQIDEKWACKLSQPWRGWSKLIAALNKVDAGAFKSATDDFRSKHTHRFIPYIELGLSQTMKRLPVKGRSTPCYGMGGSPPLKLSVIAPKLRDQCLQLSRCYAAFQRLVNEQSTLLFEGAWD